MITGFKKTMLASAVAAMLSLTGCGGGGGSAPSSSAITPPPTPMPTPPPSAASKATLTTPQYAAGSAEAAMFAQLNQYRQQCGFAPVQENTILDQAALNHAMYQQMNNQVSDDEVAGKPGFTGVTVSDRVKNQGWDAPSNVGAVNAANFVPINSSGETIGTGLLREWLGAPYHSAALFAPQRLIGIGVYSAAYNSTEMGGWGVILNSDYPQETVANPHAPLTFPCQGITGMPYLGAGETPTPPSVNGTWGTPIVIEGSLLMDKLVITSASITPVGGAPVAINILNSTNDPNYNIGHYVAVAYPTSPLSPSTTYSVNIVGTLNGVTFTRAFTFSTGY